MLHDKALTRLLLAVALVAPAARLYADEAATPKRHFAATTPAQTRQWQTESRKLLWDLLKLSDLQATREPGGEAIPFEVKELVSEDRSDYVWKEIELNSTPTRRIKAVLTLPKAATKDNPAPAVVSIHGHGGTRYIVYDPKSLYNGFATKLAEDGYATISMDVGQHEVYEKDRSLMGERLWDVLRCADYLAQLPEVDADRMGCAGLSLGGEMTMWLGAMDPRMKATVSSGFLTTVENMRHRHCPCWDFPGLTENFDFSDIYSLTAPRALLCQIGEKERAPGGFPLSIAREALTEIEQAYKVFDASENVVLDVHPEGHIYVVPSPHKFLDKHLKP